MQQQRIRDAEAVNDKRPAINEGVMTADPPPKAKPAQNGRKRGKR